MIPMKKKLTDKIQAQIDLFVYNNKVGTKENPNIQKWIQEDIYQGGKPVGGFKIINISEFFKSLRLSWIRRYAISKEKTLNDHWCDLLDMILEVTPQERMSVINRGVEFLTPKVLKHYPCLTEFLKSLLLYIVVESASGIDSLALLEIPLPGLVLFP